MYEIFVEDHFSAAHQIKEYGGNCEKVHGHNWKVKVFVRVKELNELGLGVDFRELKKELKKVLDELDHVKLEEITPFKNINPTSENIAKYIFNKLSSRFNSGPKKVSKVEVCETPGAGVVYSLE